MKKRIIQAICFIALVIFLAGLIQNHRVMAEPPVNNYIFSSVTVSRSLSPQPISPFIWGGGDNGGLAENPSAVDPFIKFGFNDRQKQLAETMGLKIIRNMYFDNETGGGCDGNGNPLPYLSLDEMLSISSQLGAQLMIIVPALDNTSAPSGYCMTFAGNKGTPQKAAQIVDTYKGRIKYYEIGNEPWATSWSSDPTQYTRTAVQFAQAMKQVDPTIKIAIVGYPTTGNNQNPGQVGAYQIDQAWTNAIKNVLNDQCSGVPCFDYVTDHPYSWTGYNPNYPIAVTNFPGVAAYFPIINYASIFTQRIQDYQPKGYAATEWNIVNWYTPPVGALGTVEQGMYTLGSLFEMADKGVAIGNFFTFQRYSGSSTLFDSSGEFTTSGKVFSFSSVLAGGQLLYTQSAGPTKSIPTEPTCIDLSCLHGGVDAPYVSSYSGISSDGTTYVFIINRHDSLAANTTVNLSGLANVGIGNITAKYLTANNYTDTVFGEHDETMLLPANKTLAVNVPPVSVVRLQIPPSGSVQGCKILGTSGDCYAATNSAFDSTQVMLDGVAATAQGNSAANSYAFPDVSAGSHTITVPLPPSGYILSGYSLCINQTGCHTTLTGTGNSVSVDIPVGGYADLWWHFNPVYTPTPYLTSPPLPTISAIDISAQASIPGDLNGVNGVDYADVDTLKYNFGNTGPPGFTPSDINKDGTVDIFDYNIQVENFGRTN